jgi:hypothetical protein
MKPYKLPYSNHTWYADFEGKGKLKRILNRKSRRKLQRDSAKEVREALDKREGEK